MGRADRRSWAGAVFGSCALEIIFPGWQRDARRYHLRILSRHPSFPLLDSPCPPRNPRQPQPPMAVKAQSPRLPRRLPLRARVHPSYPKSLFRTPRWLLTATAEARANQTRQHMMLTRRQSSPRLMLSRLNLCVARCTFFANLLGFAG
jgi:hypothetical protein